VDWPGNIRWSSRQDSQDKTFSWSIAFEAGDPPFVLKVDRLPLLKEYFKTFPQQREIAIIPSILIFSVLSIPPFKNKCEGVNTIKVCYTMYENTTMKAPWCTITMHQ
jgi:hypothetical protein